MTFREWLTYPEPGNWVFVLQNIPAGARGAISLPKGTYLVMPSEDRDSYNLKNKRTDRIYQVYVDDFDNMVKEKVVRAAE
ncbi:MAG: hypothetical protein M0R80_02390 [Proteobacteria bacterium]|jgi:hypothetical protein|nr:hypothetical protein [Pseudomonadota bacterium]